MQEAARRARRGPGGQGSLSPVSASLSATRTRTPPRRRKLIFCALSTCRMAVSLCEQRGSEGREHGACRARQACAPPAQASRCSGGNQDPHGRSGVTVDRWAQCRGRKGASVARRAVSAPAIPGGLLPAHGLREPPLSLRTSHSLAPRRRPWSWHVPGRAATPLS